MKKLYNFNKKFFDNSIFKTNINTNKISLFFNKEGKNYNFLNYTTKSNFTTKNYSSFENSKSERIRNFKNSPSQNYEKNSNLNKNSYQDVKAFPHYNLNKNKNNKFAPSDKNSQKSGILKGKDGRPLSIFICKTTSEVMGTYYSHKPYFNAEINDLAKVLIRFCRVANYEGLKGIENLSKERIVKELALNILLST